MPTPPYTHLYRFHALRLLDIENYIHVSVNIVSEACIPFKLLGVTHIYMHLQKISLCVGSCFRYSFDAFPVECNTVVVLNTCKI